MEGSGLVPSVRGTPRGVKAAWLIFAFAVCSIFALVVYAERAEARETKSVQYFRPGGNNICLKEQSRFYDLQPFTSTHYGSAATEVFDQRSCYYRNYKPAGNITSKAVVWVYRPSYGWQVCRDTGWKYNPVYNFSFETAVNVGYYGCGDNLAHATMAQGAVWSYPSWRYSGGVWSGYLYT